VSSRKYPPPRARYADADRIGLKRPSGSFPVNRIANQAMNAQTARMSDWTIASR
jgi:hypothetical protein